MQGTLVPLVDGVADLARHRVVRGGVETALSTREAELLGYLARAGREVSREELLTEVWRYRATNPTRAVDMCVRRLRAKIERDPAEPVHVITLLGHGYRFVPPATSAVDVAPARPTTAFFGRRDDVAALTASLAAPGAFVTLLGGPGMGKTRLAVEVAAGGRAVVCDLVPARDALSLGAAVAVALGAEPGSDPLRAATDALRAAGDALVVLDNFEQLVACAPIVARWRAEAPRVRFLVTSRARLDVPGEVVHAVGPLDASAGLALLTDRAAALGVDVDPEQGARVVERVQGIPLAIALAAGRLRALSPAQLAERLDSHLRLLVSRGADRHATMRGALAWSWDLLDDDERRMLEALGVLRGSFDLEAVEEIAAPEGDAWPDEVLGRLIDHSLVHVHDSSTGRRYRLYECVREYAVERLGDRATAVRERHLRYHVAAGEQLFGALPLSDALARLEALRPDLLAAWEFAEDADTRGRVAVVLGELLARRGPRALLDAVVLDAPLPGDAAVASRLLTVGGHYALFARDLETARARLTAAEARAATSPVARGDAAELRGKLLAAGGDADGAITALRAARAAWAEAGSAGRAAWMALEAALVREPAPAAALDAAEAELHAVGDAVGLAVVAGARAWAALASGDAPGAAWWLDRAGWTPDRYDAPATMAAATVARVEEALGRYERALVAARHRVEARAAYATPELHRSARLHVVRLLAALSRTDEALAEADRCAGATGAVGRRLRATRALVACAAGDVSGALAILGAGPAGPHGDVWDGICRLTLGEPAEAALARGLHALAPGDPLRGVAVCALGAARGEAVRWEAPPIAAYADRAATGRAEVELAAAALLRVR